MPVIESSKVKVGLEVHVELATRTKMFTRVGNPAHPDFCAAAPNSLIDPVVLGLPGTLPVMNRQAVEMAMLIGLALGCRVGGLTKWDRKNYFYPDLPKNYQISQYDRPLCGEGVFELPMVDENGQERVKRIGIVRAHLEEDAGKLLHEAPGGGAIDHSIVDYNRAGTPLLEIVTAPDFESAEEVEAFARTLRNICRFLGVSEAVMQRGQMRFEPNVNCILRLDDGREVATPIVEVKNLNSFRSLRGAVEYEAREQPRRFLEDGRAMAPGAKTTRGWDDVRQVTFPQREKEEAHDYRYFPDPDLPPVVVDDEWIGEVRRRLVEPPHLRERRYRAEFGLGRKESAALVEERETCLFYERTIDETVAALPSADRARAGKLCANMVLQSGFKRANERGVRVDELGITPAQVAGIVALREAGQVSAAGADELFGALCESDEDARTAAGRLGLMQVRDEAALARWCGEAIAAQPTAAADVRAGRMQALGRLVGEVMKRSGGKADASAARALLLATLTQNS